MTAARAVILTSLLFYPASAAAQTVEHADREPVAVLELGGASAWNVKGGSSFGASAAVEVTAIEKWLELEAGVTPLFRRHSTEWDTGILFKKPWSLSKKIEFMFGVGPSWVRTRESGVTTNSAAADCVAEFMFWSSPRHRLGWYLAPGYEYSFGREHEQSLGVTAGLLIGIP